MTFGYRLISFTFALFLSGSAFCQNEKLPEYILSIAEELSSEESDPEAASIFIEQLHELYDNPVDVNSGDETEIARLFFLTEFQVKSLASYIRTSGKIVSDFEIASIPGFDRPSAEMINPFITLNGSVNPDYDSLIWRNTLLTNLIFKPGVNDTSLYGSSFRMLSKYRFTSGSFSGGMTAEKDPGERFFSEHPPLTDFMSANLTFSGKGALRKIIMGDFSQRYGLGTAINNGMRTGLSLTVLDYMPGRDGIRPYGSTDENNFFRGIATEIALKNISVFTWYSLNKIDASINHVAGSASFYVDNLYKSGLHNTSSLLLKKNALTETAYGISLSYNFSSLRAGMLWSENSFSIPFINRPDDLYGFTGTRNSVYSVYYSGLIDRILLYGEFSMNNPEKKAFVQGITLRASDRLTINLLYRNYSPGFISFHGKGPASGTNGSNEYGIAGNFTFEAARHLFISGGADVAKFPWLRYRCSFPSLSKREEVRLRYIPDEKLNLEISCNYRYSMVDAGSEQGVPKAEEVKSRTIRCSAKYFPDTFLTLSSRVDLKSVGPYHSHGILMLQDLIYRFRRIPFTLWLRYCIFNTDDWNSRLYAYENDLLYNFSIPALSGDGRRSYIMLKWEPGDFAEIRIKYSVTSLVKDNINTEDQDELRVQMRIWF